MKPIRLEMCAFGSYHGATAIDFGRLGDCGLYLVTGDTGSGKTTIFDAISYALYGRASGADRGDASVLRSVRAGESDETYVALTFSHGGRVWEVRRNMKCRRKLPNAVLTYDDGTVIEGVRRVDAAVQDLLGIRYEHFSKILMIAQGDFARLLMADTRDREPILRSIFDTSVFELFQKELSNRAAGIAKDIAPLRGRMEARMAAVKLPDGHAYHDKIALISENPSAFFAGDFVKLVSEAAEWDKNLLAEAEKAGEAARQNLDGVIALIADARKLNADFDALGESRRALAALEADKARALEIKGELEAAERAARADAPAMAVESARRLSRESESALANVSKEIAELEVSYAARTALCEEAESGRAAAEAARADAELVEAVFARYDELSALREALTEAEKKARLSEQTALSAKEKAAALEARGAEIDARRKDMEGTGAEAAREEAALSALKERAERLSRLRVSLEGLRLEREAYNSKRGEMEKALKREAELTRRNAAVRAGFFAAQAGLLALSLAPGERCPVCGSREHPQPAQVATDAPDQSAMDKSEKELSLAKGETQRLSAEIAGDKSRITVRFFELRDEFFAITGTDAQAETRLDGIIERRNAMEKVQEQAISDSETRLRALRAALLEDARLAGERADIARKLPGLTSEREKLDAERERLRAEAGALAGRAQQAAAGLMFPSKKEAEDAAAGKRRVYQKWDSDMKAAVEARDKCQTGLASARDRRAMLENQRAARQTELAEREADFQSALTECGFASSAEYAAARRNAESIAVLKKATEDRTRALDYHKRVADSLEKALAGRVRADADVLENRRREAQSALDVSAVAISEIRRRINEERDCARVLEKEDGIFRELNRKNEVMQTLSNVAGGKGKSSAGKITFERFILMNYFDRVLRQANVRFSRMSHGQYEMARALTATDLRSQTGLELNVLDNCTGGARSVRSLSGGEAFMASISLALGFADVIRQSAGVVVAEAMFVDEGFGSLDADALDQVMNVLADLAGSDKLIGIISHVSELRGRIDRQIIVEKTRDGSRVRVEV